MVKKGTFAFSPLPYLFLSPIYFSLLSISLSLLPSTMGGGSSARFARAVILESQNDCVQSRITGYISLNDSCRALTGSIKMTLISYCLIAVARLSIG